MPLLLLALVAGAACDRRAAELASSTAPIEVVDDAGNRVRLAAPARRVVSLIPARTDAILALGAEDRLIARTQYDEDARIAHLPSVGNALTPSVEWLVAQNPDLVIAWPDEQSRSVVTRLVQLGIPVYASRVQTLGDVERAIRQIGVLLGLETRADSVLRSIRHEYDAVRAAVAERDPPDVLYLIGLDPVMAVGTNNFMHELIGIAGGRNVFGDVDAMWPQVSLEEIVRRDPDVVVIAIAGPEARGFAGRLAARPGWSEVRAVREGRVHVVDAGVFNRPGPAVGPAARMLAERLHPGAMSEAR